MDIDQLNGWLQRYADAWEQTDPAAAADLFTADGSYHVTPFQSHDGKEAIRDYWAQATDDQETVTVETEAITVTDDGRGIGRFRAKIIDTDGEESVTDGICVILLDGDSCTAFREWWHKDRFHHEQPSRDH